MDSQLPPPQNGAREHALPRVDLSPIRPDYSSDLFNRDVFTGEVNKDGITVGKVSETVVELSAPIVAGKVFSVAELPQALHIENATTETLVYEADAMAAKPGNGGRAIIGRRAKAEEISAAERELEKGGIKIIKNADARINKLNIKAAAAFDFEEGELLLRKDATFLEMFHEKAHAEQWAKLGKEQYKAIGTLAREEHVYKTIIENKQLFSERELKLAKSVIDEYRRRKSFGKID